MYYYAAIESHKFPHIIQTELLTATLAIYVKFKHYHSFSTLLLLSRDDISAAGVVYVSECIIPLVAPIKTIVETRVH